MRKIFITGCAKSGTTLVRRLFNAFEGLKVCNSKEMTLDEFIDSDYNVAKRTYETIFSADIPHDEICRQAGLIVGNQIEIVNVWRWKDDVLKSDNGYVNEERWLASMKHRLEYTRLIDYDIHYNNLTLSTDSIQLGIARHFNLDIKHAWSTYPDFLNIEEEDPLHRDGIYRFRKIGEKA